MATDSLEFEDAVIVPKASALLLIDWCCVCKLCDTDTLELWTWQLCSKIIVRVSSVIISLLVLHRERVE